MASKNHPESFRPFILTGGDPAGISPEIGLDAVVYFLEHSQETDVLIYFHTSDQHDLALLQNKIEQACGTCLTFSDLDELTDHYLQNKNHRAKILILDLFKMYNPEIDNFNLQKGIPSIQAGFLSWKALQLASNWIKEHSTAGLLTAPLSKKWVNDSIHKLGKDTDTKYGTSFSGHTGYLAEFFTSEVMMLMHGIEFSVVPLTTHIALRDVPDSLRKTLEQPGFRDCLKLLNKMNIFKDTNWALCALNPHAGEDGLMGDEEKNWLGSLCMNLKNEGYRISGPLPSDTLFTRQILPKYRLVFSCYHDQGLIPFKAMEAENGVNCTIGLPFARCSPDHGTAYDIAGKNMAHSGSMIRSMAVLLNEELRIDESA